MRTADAHRFKGLVEPHLDALFRAAFRLARNRADAEDLVQETCVRAYLRIAELRESQPVKAWLLRVLHNVFVDGARRARRSPVTAVQDDAELASSACPDPNPEERAGMTQREDQLHRAWSQLDRGHRALLQYSRASTVAACRPRSAMKPREQYSTSGAVRKTRVFERERGGPSAARIRDRSLRKLCSPTSRAIRERTCGERWCQRLARVTQL